MICDRQRRERLAEKEGRAPQKLIKSRSIFTIFFRKYNVDGYGPEHDQKNIKDRKVFKWLKSHCIQNLRELDFSRHLITRTENWWDRKAESSRNVHHVELSAANLRERYFGSRNQDDTVFLIMKSPLILCFSWKIVTNYLA